MAAGTALQCNYDLAYTGVGRSLLQDEEYDQAAEYFKLGNNRRDYSKLLETSETFC